MATERHFKKSLNLFDSAAITMGSMIGSGIFIVSADIARNVGSPGWLLVVWAVTTLMTVLAALSYGELASMLPHVGGIYVYLKEAYSPLFGFLYGWTFFLVIQCGTIAAVAMAFAKFTGVLLPVISEQNILLDLGLFKFNTTQLLAIMMILFLTWINTRGIKEGKRVQNIFTYSKVFILLAFIVIGIFVAKATQLNVFHSPGFWEASKIVDNQQVPVSGFSLIIAIGLAMVGSIFAADAWYNITYTSDEVINPKKTIARSLFLGTLTVCLIYFLVNVVYIIALPVRGIPYGATVMERGIQFATADRVATAAIYGIFGKNTELLMAVVVVISTFGCNNGIILSGARVTYAMAKDRLFFKKTGELSKTGVPAFGLWIQAIWSTLLCLTGTYSQLLDYVVFAALLFYILVIFAVFMLRIKHPEWERPYKAFGFPVFPIIYIAACLLIIIILLIYKPLFTWPGLGIVISGIPVYYLWKRRSHKGPVTI
ncbi:MAG: amino acid permease [Bacteroidales bacterium]|nr:amino acid permease [Bacteroidales bacterium]